MIITDKIALRLLEKREWLTPEEGLKKAEVHGFLTEALSSIKELKKRLSNRSDIEEHQAALFVGGLKSRAPCFTWEYSPGELGEINREADCFCRVNIDGQYYYKPLQLKEVVAGERRGNSLQDVINGLAGKYAAQAGQENLVVAIRVSRAMTIDFAKLTIPAELRIQQLWLFGLTGPRVGFIVGDLLGDNPEQTDFPLPEFHFRRS